MSNARLPLCEYVHYLICSFNVSRWHRDLNESAVLCADVAASADFATTVMNRGLGHLAMAEIAGTVLE